MMRHLLLLLAQISLAACNSERPVDCEAIKREVYSCINRLNGNGDNRGTFEECVPMGKAERFHGTWASDFEFNQFQSGKILAVHEAWQISTPSTALVTEGSDLERYEKGQLASVLEITFTGRRPQCNLTDPYRQIVVDRVIDIHPIEVRPSQWNRR